MVFIIFSQNFTDYSIFKRFVNILIKSIYILNDFVLARFKHRIRPWWEKLGLFISNPTQELYLQVKLGLLIPFRYKNLRNKYKTWDFCFQFHTRTVIFCPHFDTKSKDTGKARIICVSNLTQDLYVIRLKDYVYRG